MTPLMSSVFEKPSWPDVFGRRSRVPGRASSPATNTSNPTSSSNAFDSASSHLKNPRRGRFVERDSKRVPLWKAPDYGLTLVWVPRRACSKDIGRGAPYQSLATELCRASRSRNVPSCMYASLRATGTTPLACTVTVWLSVPQGLKKAKASLLYGSASPPRAEGAWLALVETVETEADLASDGAAEGDPAPSGSERTKPSAGVGSWFSLMRFLSSAHISSPFRPASGRPFRALRFSIRVRICSATSALSMSLLVKWQLGMKSPRLKVPPPR